MTCPCDLYPLAPHFYVGKQGIRFFLIFALKHRPWVQKNRLDEADLRAIIRKLSQFFSSENYQFYSREILQYITWACLGNEYIETVLQVLLWALPVVM